jgi:Tfp pilus assembly protein PilN
MSQQLNLLPKAKTNYSPALAALLILGIVILVLFAIWGVKRSILASARAEEAASAVQLKVVTAQLEERFRARSAQLNAEIEALRPRAAAAEQVLALAAGVGKPEGYSPYFSALATVREEGVWLTGVTVNQAGKSLRLSGQSLDKDALLRYTRRVDAAFANEGIHLSALEMTMQTLVPAPLPAGAGMAGAKGVPLNVIKFTLH